jgi:hypothetical protein
MRGCEAGWLTWCGGVWEERPCGAGCSDAHCACASCDQTAAASRLTPRLVYVELYILVYLGSTTYVGTKYPLAQCRGNELKAPVTQTLDIARARARDGASDVPWEQRRAQTLKTICARRRGSARGVGPDPLPPFAPPHLPLWFCLFSCSG